MPWGLPFLLYRVCINNRKIYLSSHFIVYVPGCVSVWLPRHRCVSRFACRPGGGHMAPTDLTSLIIFPLSGANHPATQPPSHPVAQLPKCRPFQSHQPCLYVLPFSPNFYIDWSIFVLSAFARLGPCGFRIWIWIWIWLWLWLWLCLPFRHMQNKQEREVSRRGVFILRRRCK